MIRTVIADRLIGHALSEATTTALLHLVSQDTDQLMQHPPIAAMFALLPELLHGVARIVTPFRVAWTLMYAAISRLDALQDGDPMHPEAASPSTSLGAHYNLVFATYVLAASLLDDLAEVVPAARLLCVQRLWSNSMLRMADGQQHDLGNDKGMYDVGMLAAYQQIAQAKTGATYALAFGGLATLLTDDAALITAMVQVGEIYGTLVQYSDDLHDARTQPNQTVTLPAVLRCLPLAVAHPPAQIEAAFWAYLLPIYQQAAATALAAFPELQTPIARLFTDVFAAPDPV